MQAIIITGAPIEETAKNQKAINDGLQHILAGYTVETILVQAVMQKSGIMPAYGIASMVWTELKNTYPQRKKQLVTVMELKDSDFVLHNLPTPIKHINMQTATMKTNLNIVQTAERAVANTPNLSSTSPTITWTVVP